MEQDPVRVIVATSKFPVAVGAQLLPNDEADEIAGFAGTTKPGANVTVTVAGGVSLTVIPPPPDVANPMVQLADAAAFNVVLEKVTAVGDAADASPTSIMPIPVDATTSIAPATFNILVNMCPGISWLPAPTWVKLKKFL
jgi:hypothetical protein